jgi:PadR family transcriptional regulator, regulatory protein AphA
MAEPEGLTTTSYAILGYLAVRPWTAYELTKQLGRSFHHFWPRAESGIYREFKRLTAAGLAVATEERTGGRARSRYELTDEGRAALDRWRAEPRSDGFLESEGLVRMLFADQGTEAQARQVLAAMVDDADATATQMVEVLRDYLATGGDFPERAHVNVLTAGFLVDFAGMVREWAAWSAEVIDDWPDRPGTRTVDDERIRARIRQVVDAHEPVRPAAG